jgi:hypothetical protein
MARTSEISLSSKRSSNIRKRQMKTSAGVLAHPAREQPGIINATSAFHHGTVKASSRFILKLTIVI